MNTQKLKGKITEMYNTQSNFARVLNLTPQALSKKMKQESQFKLNEIKIMIELLKLTKQEAFDIFFDT